MWADCAQFLDPDVLERATKSDFYAVWWELYLAYALKRTEVPLVARKDRATEKEAPDLLAESPRVWLEAVMPEPGSGADQLSEPPPGKVYSVPTDAFVLRLCNVTQNKMGKYAGYIEKGMILPGDATIIAISGGRLPFRFAELETPSIVRALFGVGWPVVEIDRATRKIVDGFVEHRNHVVKQSNERVSTDVFLRKESAHVSAVLYSASDCVNHPARPGDDFILVHNPNALVPVPETWLSVGAQYWIEEGFRIIRKGTWHI